jgi:hypothetical protein
MNPKVGDTPQFGESACSERAEAVAKITEFLDRRITEARWHIADAEKMDAHVLANWLRHHEAGLADLRTMIPPPGLNTSVSGPCPPDAAQLQHKLSGG